MFFLIIRIYLIVINFYSFRIYPFSRQAYVLLYSNIILTFVASFLFKENWWGEKRMSHAVYDSFSPSFSSLGLILWFMHSDPSLRSG